MSLFLPKSIIVQLSILSSSFGLRIFLGILTGVSLFLFNQTVNKLSIIIDIPPFLGAFLPVFILLLISFYIINKFYGSKVLLKLFLR